MSLLRLVGREAYFRDIYDHSLSFDETHFFWGGVRSADYFPRYHRERQLLAKRRKVARLEDEADLVPEPDNDYDPFAVGVWVREVQIGYVSATVAEYMHWHLRHLEAKGHRVAVPLLTTYGDDEDDDDDDIYAKDYPTGTWAALPTFKTLEKYNDWSEVERQLMEVWAEAPTEVRHSLTSTFLPANELLMAHLRSVRHRAPLAAIPDSEDPAALPPQLAGFFLDRRLEIQREKMLLKWELKRQRDDDIVAAVDAGVPRAEVARQVGLAVSTVSNIFRERKKSAAEEARVERAEDPSGGTAAARDGGAVEQPSGTAVADEAVPAVSEDEAFYADPSRDRERVELARIAMRKGGLARFADPKVAERARADGEFLRREHPGIFEPFSGYGPS